jgi:GDP-mannose 4,6-dehydratase
MTTRALITGITGFVGSHLLDFLIDNTDWEIHNLIRWRSPMDNIAQHIDSINRKDRIHLHYGDLNDAKSINSLVFNTNPDFVFHLAGQSYPKTSFDMPVDTLQTNIIGTTNLLEALKSLSPKAHIHVCSSSEVFGRVPKDKLPINEDCAFHPASPYAISKAGVDLLGRHYAEAYGMNVQATRMFTHTGPRRGDVFAESSFAKQIAMIEAGLQEPVIKVGNLQSLRTFADVRDAVRAYYLLLTANPQPGAVYNIGGDFSCTIEHMLDTLVDLAQLKHVTYETDPDRIRPLDADLQVPDTTKFRNHTGWEPEIVFEQTMLDLLNYWRERTKTRGAFLQR